MLQVPFSFVRRLFLIHWYYITVQYSSLTKSYFFSVLFWEVSFSIPCTFGFRCRIFISLLYTSQIFNWYLIVSAIAFLIHSLQFVFLFSYWLIYNLYYCSLLFRISSYRTFLQISFTTFSRNFYSFLSKKNAKDNWKRKVKSETKSKSSKK